MNKSADSVLKDLQKEIYAPIYFLQGEETYYIHAITQYIEKKVLPSTEQSFNLTIFYGKECAMANLITQARRFPLGAAKQVVIVKEAQEMGDLKNHLGQQLLLHYLNHPQPTTLLVFAYMYKTIDGRTAFGKALEKGSVMVTSKKVYDHQLPSFIKNLVEIHDLSITEKAAWMMQEYIGNDLSRIVSEFHKLRINLSPGNTITDTIIESYIGLHRSFHLFDLQKAIMKKDYAKSYQIINSCLLNSKENFSLPVIALLYNFFSKLLMVHQTKETIPTKIAQQLGIHPYIIQEYLKAKENYTLRHTLRNITYLHQADLQLKGIESRTNNDQIMKELIFKLMHT